jgi:ribose transport system substrate-binding protein
MAELQEILTNASTPPNKIKPAEFGAFTPKEGGHIFLNSCDLSIVGCANLANGMKAAADALGYQLDICDGGVTPQKINGCFNNAVNAKPDVIIIDGNPASVAGAGYAAAQEAGIPVIGVFTSNPEGTTTAELGINTCTQQGQIKAAAVLAMSGGDADTLYAYETSQACDIQRHDAFKETYEKYCPTCGCKDLLFDYATMQQTLPQQVQAELVQNPDLNWMVGVFDEPATVLITQIEQAGKQDQIRVGANDGVPANIQMIRDGRQAFDVAISQAENAWLAVDAAARLISGQEIPPILDTDLFLITPENVGTIPELTNTWPGPPDYEAQYRALWGK